MKIIHFTSRMYARYLVKLWETIKNIWLTFCAHRCT